MYGRNTEHTFYSLTPKLAAKATQRIRKARSQLLTVPRLNSEISSSGLLLEIPQPNHRVQPKTQSGGTLWTFGFVGLRLLTAEKLFGVFECIFYRPAVCVAGQYFGRLHRHIGCEKEVVFFFAIRVSTDNQQDRLAAHRVPENHTSINQAVDGLASLTKCNRLPILNVSGHLFQFGKFLSSGTRTAPSLLSSLGRQIVQVCISFDSGDNRNGSGCFSRQSGVKPICNHPKQPFRQPLMNFVDHLHSQLYQGQSIFSVQSHVDRQAQRFAAPGRLDLQSQDDQIQAPGIDYVFPSRTDGISPPSGAVDYRDMFNAIVGEDWTTEQLLEAGERIWNLERTFNLKAGVRPEEDKLPRRLVEEPIADGPAKGHVHHLAELLPEYYKERGWSEKGSPSEEKLAQLGIA